MTAGLRIRDGSGNVVFDFTERFARIIGQASVTTVTGSVSVDNTYGGSIWYQYAASEGFRPAPLFTVSGNTISWSTYQENSSLLPIGTLIYGRY